MMGWLKKNKEVEVLPPLEGYNLWATSYHQESNPIKNLSDNLVEKFLPDLHGKAMLDAGCGTGKFCSLAETQNASKILGLDLSPSMIEEARINCTSAEFRCGDLSGMVIEENTFDVGICALVLGHIQHLTPALNNLLRALKSDGTLIITDFHPFLTLHQSKRTFRDPTSGKSFEVRHHLHLFEAYFSIFHKHKAVVEVLEEPLFKGTPVVFGLKVKKK